MANSSELEAAEYQKPEYYAEQMVAYIFSLHLDSCDLFASL